MKKLFLIWLLSVFCLNLFGCGSKINEVSVIPPLTNDVLLDLAAQALPCDEWTSFANFALLWTWVSREWNLMYYWVDEVVWYKLAEDGSSLKDTCYRIAPIAMEIHQSDKWFELVNVEAVENYEGDFLIEDYNPEFDGWKLDEAVEKIFSPKAFAVWQQRDYWEHFTDYGDVDRKSYEDRAFEHFGIEPPKTEDFVSYYDNWAIKEKWTYVNWKKQWTWITYDEEWNVVDMQEYKDWELVGNEEEAYDILNDKNLLSLYPELSNWFDWSFVLWDTLQTNYISWSSSIYYDPYRGIALKLWNEFDLWLIREIDTDENGYPHSEIIFLVKGYENEENRTWINWFKEVFTITAISKQILDDFKVAPEFKESLIWENNQYYFTLTKSDVADTINHYSDLKIFNVSK